MVVETSWIVIGDIKRERAGLVGGMVSVGETLLSGIEDATEPPIWEKCRLKASEMDCGSERVALS